MAKGRTTTKAAGFSLPLGELVEGHHMQRHLDVRLSPHQAQNLKRLTNGLDAQQAKLQNGGRVHNGPTALRWLLENLDNIAGESGSSGTSG